MADMIKCAGVILLYFFLFYVAGYWVQTGISRIQRRKCKQEPQQERPPVSETILIGFFTYYLLFQLVTVPMMFTLQPLDHLTKVWTGLVCLGLIVTIFLWFRAGSLPWKRERKPGIKERKEQTSSLWNRFWHSCSYIIVLAQTILVSVITYSYWDATYYVGTVSFSLYHNAINTYNPLTGRLLDHFDLKHCLATYHMHDAVVCQLFGIHPLVETKTIMVIVITILVGMVYYRIARYLFAKDEFAVAAMMGFCLLLNLCSYSLYTSASFLIFRTYEGKAITGALTTAVLLYLFLKIYGHPWEKRNWIQLFLVSWGAMAVSASAMILVPTAILAYGCVVTIHERKWQPLLRSVLCTLPCVAALLLYLLSRMGYLKIYAWR